MIVPSLLQVIGPFGAVGLSADNDGVLLDVISPFEHPGQSPAAMAGLVPGDHIDLRRMRCTSLGSEACATAVTVLGGLGGLQYTLPGRAIDLPVSGTRGQPSRTVPLHAALAPLRWPARIVLLADTLVGILFIVMAFHLVWTRPGGMTWGFFLYAAWFNPGQTFAFYAGLQVVPALVLVEQVGEALLRGAAYAGLLGFALRFPSDIVGARWRRLDRLLPWTGAALAAATLASAGNLFGFGTEAITRAGLLAGYALDAVAIGILLVRRRELAPQDGERMRWVLAGVMIGVPAFILAAICQSSGLLQSLWGAAPSQVAIGLLYLLNGVLAYFVGVAVRRRRVVSVAVPLRHGSVVAFLTLALAIPVVWLDKVTAEYQDHLDLPSWLWLLVVAPVLLVAFQRLHELAVELVDRTLNRRFHRARHRLIQAGHAMLKAETFGDVDRLLVEAPVAALRLSSAAVFRMIEGTYRRMQPSPGWSDSPVRELRPDVDTLALGSIARDEAVRLPEGAWDRRGLPTQEWAPCLAIPVRGGAREAIAVALFGPHENGSDINVDELQMLLDLASRAATSYDRVETVALRREIDELRHRLARLTVASKPGSSPMAV